MLTDNLVKLLTLNSHSLNRAGVNQKLDLIQTWTKDLSITWTRTSSEKFGDLMIGRTETKPGLPRVGLLLHVDTVHASETPYPVKTESNKMFGPGAQDMQGSIAVVVELLHVLLRRAKLHNTTVILNSSEEFGTPEFKPELHQVAHELDYVMTYEASGNGKYTEDDSRFTHNLVLVNQRKGVFCRKLATSGPGGHSGVLARKEQRHNAISQAVQMMKAIDDLADYDKGTTVNLEFVTGGQLNTIIATNCEFAFDVRFVYLEERQRVLDAVDRIMRTEFIPGVQVEDKGFIYDFPSLPPNSGSDEFANLVQVAVQGSGLEVEVEKRGGGSDASILFFHNPQLKVLDGFGPKGDGEHTAHEFVYIDSLDASLKLSKLVIEHLLTT